jgi:hypothetical protein
MITFYIPPFPKKPPANPSRHMPREKLFVPLRCFFGGLAQMVERQHGMLEASGSSPLPSTGG